MWPQAPRHHPIRRWRLEPYEPLPPADRQHSGGLDHSLRIIPERAVEHGRFADGAVDQIRLGSGFVAGNGDIDLHRSGGLLRERSTH